MRTGLAIALLSIAIGAGSAFAQNTPTAPAAPKMAPMTAPMTAPGAAATDKKAVSKACTDQADAKGLHGKARKKFRSECKHNSGKAA